MAAANFAWKEIPFLSYCPKKRQGKVPLIVYFGGGGEMGTNVVSLLRQRTIFNKVTSETFQNRHPCRLIAPVVPINAQIHGGLPTKPSPICVIVKNLIDVCCSKWTCPTVDKNRIYITGLSLGGALAFELPAYYPGFFAASVPVSSFMGEQMIPKKKACRYWLICNKSSFMTDTKRGALDSIGKLIRASGGDFRISYLPGVGHNAWDAAWSDMNVWDWMFDQVSGFESSHFSVVGFETNVPYDAECGFVPECVVDGLKSTSFVSSCDVGYGSFWKCEFSDLIMDRMRLKIGSPDGRLCIRDRIVIYGSRDSVRWDRMGVVRKRDGCCEFGSSCGIKFLKVVYEGRRNGCFALHDLHVISKGRR